MRILHNKTLSEEAVSESFFAVAKSFSKISTKTWDEIVAYGLVINRNVSYRIYNREKKHWLNEPNDILIYEKEDLNASDEFDDVVTFELLGNLSVQSKDILLMKYYYDLSVSEIAKAFGLSVGGTKHRLEKARIELRKEVEKCDGI